MLTLQIPSTRMLSSDLTNAADNDIVAFSNDKIFIYENNDDGTFSEIFSDNLSSSMRLENYNRWDQGLCYKWSKW